MVKNLREEVLKGSEERVLNVADVGEYMVSVLNKGSYDISNSGESSLQDCTCDCYCDSSCVVCDCDSCYEQF